MFVIFKCVMLCNFSLRHFIKYTKTIIPFPFPKDLHQIFHKSKTLRMVLTVILLFIQLKPIKKLHPNEK